MIKLYRWIWNLRCPECDAVQPVFGLRSTMGEGPAAVVLNETAACPSCGARLRLVYRFNPGTTFSWNMGYLLMNLAMIFFVTFPAVIFSVGRFGMVGLFVLPIIGVFTSVLRAFMVHYYFPRFHKVVSV